MTVELVEKGPLVRLLNISTYQLTAIDSADETMRIEGDPVAEETFNGSDLRGLTNDHNYTFALRVFYFPVGSAELSNLSLRIDYADTNAENIRDADGITIGSNWDEDYLADLVDLDDDNDGLNDLDNSGAALDDCPRGDIGWRSNKTTDNDGDGCRDAGEDMDDDNDNVTDSEDLGEYKGRLCRLFADCDNDTVLDVEDLGEFNGESCRVKPDCDDDTIADVEDNCPVIADSNQADGDGDGLGNLCDLDADGDGLIEIGTAAELDAVRWALNGSGRRLSEGAALDQAGCGNGADKIACSGYELVRDISLAAYAGGEGWVPLGNDTDSGMLGCQGTAFSGVFDGNGWTVRELNISRGGEDCIGLFGRLAAGTVIRNLTVEAETVIGRDRVGGLVGNAANAKILSSYSVAGEVSGTSNNVGGLVGYGDDAEIVSSSSVAGEVKGAAFVGGLMGWGGNANIVSSSSVVGEVRGSGFSVGGLVGDGGDAEVVSSYSVAGEVSGAGSVGGLMGWGGNANIVSSSSVVGEVRSAGSVGGLVGGGGAADSSYWYTTVSVADNGKGENKTLTDLRTPTNDNAYDTSSIYANWAVGASITGGDEIEDITIYCDEDFSGDIETAEMRDGTGSGGDNRIWDFGGSDDYPAIRCLPLSLAEQRSWWFINSTGHPNVNRTRLDALTSP